VITRLDDEATLVMPDGLSVRRRRHDQSWSPRDLVTAIGDACERATGLRESISPQLLSGIEERNERISYSTLRLLAGGLDCDPVDILKSVQPVTAAPVERRSQ
jgi:transcriptional regulator with XRE-family HTH domain